MSGFSATYRLTIISSKPIVASTMEEALEKAKKLKATDFVKFKPGCDYCDGADVLLSVSNDEPWIPE